MIAEVIVDVLNSNVDKIFDYKMPEGEDIAVGHRVLVPFAGRTTNGYVINTKEKSDFDADKLKCIIKKLISLLQQ